MIENHPNRPLPHFWGVLSFPFHDPILSTDGVSGKPGAIQMAAEGLPLTVIVQELGKDLDPFDLVCHIAFDAKPLTRCERAENVKKRDVFTKYGGQARAVLGALLDKYADEGMLNIDDANVLRIPPLDSLGTPVELVSAFGGKPGFERAVHDLQFALYREIA